MRCLAHELSRVWSGSDQTMLTIWLSQLIINLRPGRYDSAHNSVTLPLFENYLSELFGCTRAEVWSVVDEWVESLSTSSSVVSLRAASSSFSVPTG